MHPSANTPPEGLPPPPICSSAIAGTPESSNNGVGEAKPSSSSSPPKIHEFSSVSLSNLSPNNGNSMPTQENPSQSGDVFLQWGQKKRSKRSVGDKFSGSRTMPPPPTKLRTNINGVFSSKDSSSSLRNRNIEESSSTRMGNGGGGSPPSKNQEPLSRSISSRSTVGKRSEKSETKKTPCSSSFVAGVGVGSIRKEKLTESLLHHHQSDHHQMMSPARGSAAASEAEKEVVEWPRIFIALSRKEKEDDFFSMKGTKLPHRPKKRAKAIDRTLQYCFPGMWLSDLSRARYEVRERKSVKKQPRRRGLKGLDSMESDSD